MHKDDRLEEILYNLISRIDDKRIHTEDGNDTKVTINDSRWNYARVRKPNELSLAKITRKLFGIYGDRILKIPLLSDEENEALIYFTQRRKELGALWTGYINRRLKDNYSKKVLNRSGWNSSPVRNEAEFIDVLVNKILRRGDRLFDKNMTINYKGNNVKAGDVLHDFVSRRKSGGVKDKIHEFIKKCEDAPYHMVVHWRDVLPSNRNLAAVIYGRVKESNSEDDKQARKWSEDIRDMESIAILNEYDNEAVIQNHLMNKYREAQRIAQEFEKQPAHDKKRFTSRLDEVKAKWYYGIPDSYGITVAFSHNITKSVDEVIQFLISNPFIDYVEKSRHDHAIPIESQFRVKLNRTALTTALELYNLPQHAIEELYMPDYIEIMVTSLPSLVHKYLTPGIAERDYKQRLSQSTMNDQIYQQIFNSLQSVSPVEGAIRRKSRHEHQRILLENLEYSENTDFEYMEQTQRDFITRLRQNPLF